MSAWLDPVRRALDAVHQPVRFWFRDDDAGWDDEALARLLARCHDHSVHIDLAVIPVALRDDLVTDLRRHAISGLVHLHQHGFAHVNHQAEGRKCEFGSDRSFDRQLTDLADGQGLLHGHLGPFVEPVFTPPWNRCTADTAEALVQLGFKVLSRDSTAVPFELDRLDEVSITVDWFASSKGTPLSRDQIAARIASQVEAHAVDDGPPIGVMLHHAVTDLDELARIDELMALIERHPMARSTSIAQLSRVSS